jgi:hypothetical protein
LQTAHVERGRFQQLQRAFAERGRLRLGVLFRPAGDAVGKGRVKQRVGFVHAVLPQRVRRFPDAFCADALDDAARADGRQQAELVAGQNQKRVRVRFLQRFEERVLDLHAHVLRVEKDETRASRR